MKNAGGFLAGILGGAIVGAALGMLFAPEKGEDTRKKIAENFEELKEKVIETLNNKGIKLSKNEMEDLVEELKAKVESKLD